MLDHTVSPVNHALKVCLVTSRCGLWPSDGSSEVISALHGKVVLQVLNLLGSRTRVWASVFCTESPRPSYGDPSQSMLRPRATQLRAEGIEVVKR